MLIFNIEDYYMAQHKKDLICHYTTYDTVVKILTKKILWACDFKDVDDRSECGFLSEVVYEKILKRSSPGIEFLNRLELIKENIEFFITSFVFHSEQDNKYGNLSIARYFGQDSWVGIVFKQENLCRKFLNFIEELNNQGVGASLSSGNVVYKDPDLIDYQQNYQGAATFIKDIMKEYLGENKLIEILCNNTIYTENNCHINFIEDIIKIMRLTYDTCIEAMKNEEAYLTAVTYIIFAQSMLKHIVFYAENEYRFVISLHKHSNQKLNDFISNKIKRHVEISFDFDDIHSIIIINSGNESTNIKLEIESILQKEGKNNIPVFISPIPWKSKHSKKESENDMLDKIESPSRVL